MAKNEFEATISLEPPPAFPQIVEPDGSVNSNNGAFYYIAESETETNMGYINTGTPQCDLEPKDKIVVTMHNDVRVTIWNEERCSGCIFNQYRAKSQIQCRAAQKPQSKSTDQN